MYSAIASEKNWTAGVGGRSRPGRGTRLGRRKRAIAQVFPRDSELDRPPVANADQILLVFALADPTPEPLQLSRFLIKAESTGLEVCLGLNKRDLVSPEAQIEWGDRLQRWGYPAYLFSTQQKTGLDHLQTQLQQKLRLFLAPLESASQA